MRKALLLFLSSVAMIQASDCIPVSYYRYADTLQNCSAPMPGELFLRLYKEQHKNVLFPDGYTKEVNPGGFGQCEQLGSCNPFEAMRLIRAGYSKCWPDFWSESRVNGRWSQTVIDKRIVLKTGICNGIPIFVSYTCAPKIIQRPPVAVPHSCPIVMNAPCIYYERLREAAR